VLALISFFVILVVSLTIVRIAAVILQLTGIAFDYDSLLNLSGDYEVITIKVKRDSWLAERELIDLRLSDEGVLVLAIRREDGYFIGSPRGEESVEGAPQGGDKEEEELRTLRR